MTDIKLEKEMMRPGKIKVFRKYDLIDMFTLGLYNAVVFASGLGLGWLIWVK